MYEKAGFIYINRDHPYFGNDMILTRAKYEETRNSRNRYLSQNSTKRSTNGERNRKRTRYNNRSSNV